MYRSRRTYLRTIGSAGIWALAGCTAPNPDPVALRSALSTTLSVSQASDTRLLVRTDEDFEHDVLVEEAGHRFSLDLPGLAARTTGLVPREVVRFHARAPGTKREYAHIATYTEPFRGISRLQTRSPEADVRFIRGDATTVEAILQSTPRATSARIVYADGRPDDILLWEGHRVTATDLPRGTIRAYGAYETDERLVATRVLT